MRIGIVVTCARCGLTKAPFGRSISSEAYYCTSDCDGYYESPLPGSLFPGETEKDFGYPISCYGTKEVEDELARSEE